MRESPHLRRGCRRCTGLKNTSLPYWQGAWRVPILAVRCRECERRPLSTGSDLTRACVSGHSSVDWACDLTRACEMRQEPDYCVSPAAFVRAPKKQLVCNALKLGKLHWGACKASMLSLETKIEGGERRSHIPHVYLTFTAVVV